ncbi:uncharacterized protein LOC143726088 [Siphateles boraxobius]|uniref:uncharacterized protein LOC143726088 n=1 Tax=Siphateles boraxobius TaxID=180520 RepID=UPI0040628A0E
MKASSLGRKLKMNTRTSPSTEAQPELCSPSTVHYLAKVRMKMSSFGSRRLEGVHRNNIYNVGKNLYRKRVYAAIVTPNSKQEFSDCDIGSLNSSKHADGLWSSLTEEEQTKQVLELSEELSRGALCHIVTVLS